MKYLVKQIFEEVSEVVDGVDIIRETNNVIGHIVKYKTDSKALPRGGNFIFLDGVDTKYPVISTDTDGSMSIIEDANYKLLKDAYKTMDDSVRLEASVKMQTTNKDSIFAFVDAFQLRMMIPEKYITLGLKAELDIGTYIIGDLLDDAVKIRDYYSEVLFYLDTHRIGKIEEYITTKTDLGF